MEPFHDEGPKTHHAARDNKCQGGPGGAQGDAAGVLVIHADPWKGEGRCARGQRVQFSKKRESVPPPTFQKLQTVLSRRVRLWLPLVPKLEGSPS